jgi:hypothetical protein
MNAPIATLRCNFTLVLRLNTLIAVGGSAGTVALVGISPSPCQGFTVRVLGLPWNIRLSSAASLPVGALFTIENVQIAIGPCLYQGNVGYFYTNGTGVKTVLANSLIGDGIFCGSLSFSGNGFQSSPIQRIS